MLKPLLSPLLKGGTIQAGADPNIAEIVALLTAGGDAWDFSANVDPQPGVRGSLTLARGPAGTWSAGQGKIGGGYAADFSDPGEALSDSGASVISSVFDGGDWSVNIWHRSFTDFIDAATFTMALNIYTDTGIPVRITTANTSGTALLEIYVSDVDQDNVVSLSMPIITNNVYEMITLTYTASNRTLRTYVGASLESTDALADTTSTDFTGNTGQQIRLASATASGSSEAYSFTDLLLICKGVLSQDNIDYLYNSGNAVAMSTFA